MTTNESFDRRLADWLREEAVHRVPDHLDAVLVRTVATRQRAWWSSLERWLPVDHALSPGRIGSRPLAAVLAVVAILLTLTAALIVGPGLPSSTLPLGEAENGRILIVDGPSLRSYAHDGSDPRVVAPLDGYGSALTMAPDGSRVATLVLASPHRLDIVDVADGSVTTIPAVEGATEIASRTTWSPTGDRIAFVASDGWRDHLVIAPTDGSAPRKIGTASIDATLGIWNPAWSPDGEWIAFVSADLDTRVGTLQRIRTDGTALESLPIAPVAADQAIHWSPDPATPRILYTRDVAGIGLRTSLYDLATAQEVVVEDTFWPSWSPDGRRIAVWGTRVADTEAIIALSPTWTQLTPTWRGGVCDDHLDLAGQSYCGPVQWSPDGTRVIAPDIAGEVVLSLLADGSGDPIVIDLVESGAGEVDGPIVVWQPVWP